MMSLRDFCRLSKQLRGIPILELSSGCEPTMNRELPAMLRRLREDHAEAFIELTTNGTLLAKPVIDALIESRTNKLLVSLDGATPDLFERIRRGARFAQVVSNLGRLDAEKRRSGASLPRVEAIFTLMSQNQDELPGMPDLLASIGVRALTVNGLAPFSEKAARMRLWARAGASAHLLERIRECALAADRTGIEILLPDFVPQRVVRCLDTNPVISWNGEVSPCYIASFDRTFHGESGPVRLPRVVLGNVFERPLRRIWRSRRAQLYRAGKAAGLLPSYCRQCIMQMGVLCPCKPPEAILAEAAAG